MSAPETTSAPVLRIEGAATPEQIAAVVAVLVAAGGGPEPAPRPVPRWPGRAPRSWRDGALPG